MISLFHPTKIGRWIKPAPFPEYPTKRCGIKPFCELVSWCAIGFLYHKNRLAAIQTLRGGKLFRTVPCTTSVTIAILMVQGIFTQYLNRTVDCPVYAWSISCSKMSQNIQIKNQAKRKAVHLVWRTAWLPAKTLYGQLYRRLGKPKN